MINSEEIKSVDNYKEKSKDNNISTKKKAKIICLVENLEDWAIADYNWDIMKIKKKLENRI